MSTLRTDGLRVSDVMLPLDRFPVVPKTMYLKSAMEEMGKRRLGIVCVVDDAGKLAGVFTDGDVRRKLLSVQKPFSAFFIDDVIDHAVLDPLTISASASLMDGRWPRPGKGGKEGRKASCASASPHAPQQIHAH